MDEDDGLELGEDNILPNLVETVVINDGDLSSEDFDTTLQKIKDKFNQIEIMQINQIQFLIDDLQTRLKTKDVLKKTIFGDDFRVSNTMTTCEIVKTGGKRTYFDLNKLNNPHDLMCYKKNLPGNMQISFTDRTPSATFSSFGHMTLIGGNSLDEVALCLARACHKVMYYEKLIDTESIFYVTNFNVVNRVCVCALGRNTDLLQVCENARKYGFDAEFKQHKFPSAYLTPNGNFTAFNKSLRVSVGPSGGVNILGFRNCIEVTLLSIILSEIIGPCLRFASKKRGFTESGYRNKLAKKKIKNEKWIKKTTVYKKKPVTTG